VLSNGKRCPNEALPGSRYCGLPAHQALALQDGNGSEPVEAPLAVAAEAEEATVAAEAGEVVADEATGIATVEQVPVGIPIDEPSPEDDTEEHPPAA